MKLIPKRELHTGQGASLDKNQYVLIIYSDTQSVLAQSPPVDRDQTARVTYNNIEFVAAEDGEVLCTFDSLDKLANKMK